MTKIIDSHHTRLICDILNVYLTCTQSHTYLTCLTRNLILVDHEEELICITQTIFLYIECLPKLIDHSITYHLDYMKSLSQL